MPPLVLLLAAGLDFLIGDPWNWLHPVQVMGWAIAGYSQWALHRFKSPLALRWAGVGLGLGLVVGSGTIAGLVVALAYHIHWGLGIAIESILLASCFAGRSLRAAAEDVLAVLQLGDLVETRSRLKRYVGRDTEQLSEAEVLRAVLETVTENATDGVLAPLFWAIVGAIGSAIVGSILGANMGVTIGLGPVPLAIGFKAASTLDSMVGYRTPPYTDLGWFSAKLDDRLTWIPCRLLVLSLALLSGRPRQVWQICQRDAPQDASPNSGWSECAYAAVLKVQMGGPNTYQGVPKFKPLLGDPVCTIVPDTIRRALRLTRRVFLLWLAGAIGLLRLWA